MQAICLKNIETATKNIPTTETNAKNTNSGIEAASPGTHLIKLTNFKN